MSTITKRLSVDQYDQMVEQRHPARDQPLRADQWPIVEKDVKDRAPFDRDGMHGSRSSGCCRPAGIAVRKARPHP